MMRFNHMELTYGMGELTDELRREIVDFYGTVFGWQWSEPEIVGQKTLLLRVDAHAEQFILLAESKKPMQSPGYDHLGLLMHTRTEVDDLLAACKEWQSNDERVRVKEYEDLMNGTHCTHAFYVKHLLPIWFDVQCQERDGNPIDFNWQWNPTS